MAHKLTNSRPLISIVLSTFNGSAYLQEQIDSILTQSYPHFELIITDDASTDGTINLIRNYEQKDGRIISLFHDRNQGISNNLTHALLRANGAYIAISDQDDIWLQDKIEMLLNNVRPYSAIYADSMLINPEGASLGKTLLEQLRIVEIFYGNDPLKLLYRNHISGHALLFKKELLEYCLPFTDGIMYDHQLGISAAMCGGIAFFDRPLVLHRMHENNQTNQMFMKHRHSTKIKIESVIEKRNELIKLLDFMCTMRRKLSTHGHDVSQPDQKVLDTLLCHYRKFDETFFNFHLLLMLLRYRNSIFFDFKKKRVSKCIKTARGKKWYRFF